MAKKIKPGSTSVSILLLIMDSTSTTGAGKTGLAYNTASLTCYGVRPGEAAASISLVTQTVTGAWVSGGFVEIDATNLPGVYRLDVPNARLAAGVRSSVVMLKGASGMAPVTLEIDLGDDGVKLDSTQGTVTFGQVKILASASGEGAFHIVNSASGSSGKGMYVEGGEQGTMNYASESGGIALRNRATGSFSYGQINESTGASGTGQGNSGAFADMLGDITGSIASVATGGIDTATLTSGALNAIADAFLKRDFSLVTGAASRSALYALRFLRNKWSVSGATLTVMQEDDTTPAWTATLSTDAGADPVIGSDPS